MFTGTARSLNAASIASRYSVPLQQLQADVVALADAGRGEVLRQPARGRPGPGRSATGRRDDGRAVANGIGDALEQLGQVERCHFLRRSVRIVPPGT